MNYRVVTILMNDVYTMEQGGPGNLDEARQRLYEEIDDLNNPGLGHPWRVGSKRLAIELMRRYMDGNIPERIRAQPIGDSPNDVKWELLSDETKRGVIDVLDGDFFVDRWFKDNFVKLWRASEGLLGNNLPAEMVIQTLVKTAPDRIQKSRRLDQLVVLLVARNIKGLKREIPDLKRVLASLLKKRGGRRKRRTSKMRRKTRKTRKTKNTRTNKRRRKSNRRRKSRK